MKIMRKSTHGFDLKLIFVFLFPIAIVLIIVYYFGNSFFLEVVGFAEEAVSFQITPPVQSDYSDVESYSDFIDYMEIYESDPPVYFLDEVLPVLTPDPDKISYDVVEIDASSEATSAGISVSDSSGSGLDLSVELEKDFDLEVTEDEPLVLIYHTHTTESYTDAYTGFYYSDETGRDLEDNIIAVGEALKESLAEQGIIAIHATEVHDYPSYSGAYDRSEETVLAYLEEYPSIEITIDLHRDAMIADDGTSYKPTTEIDGKNAAQIMIIAGCDSSGELGYDNWEENLIFALKLQEMGESMYDGLMRPLMFCQRAYNMWVTDTSFLVEIGTMSNTFSEAEYSGKLLGNILAEVIKEKIA